MNKMKDEFDNLLVNLCHELDGIIYDIDTTPMKAKARLKKLVAYMTETLNMGK